VLDRCLDPPPLLGGGRHARRKAFSVDGLPKKSVEEFLLAFARCLQISYGDPIAGGG
jgi:hypothetical protein